jgi:hypothetical protein
MADCTIIGDSLAVGLGAALGARCEVHARVGAGATEAGRWAIGGGGLLIVALGTNGPTPAALLASLQSIAARADQGGRRIVWILPVREPNRSIVSRVAAGRGEPALSFQPGRDGFHPRAYGPLAAQAYAYAR